MAIISAASHKSDFFYAFLPPRHIGAIKTLLSPHQYHDDIIVVWTAHPASPHPFLSPSSLPDKNSKDPRINRVGFYCACTRASAMSVSPVCIRESIWAYNSGKKAGGMAR
ncbi:hypothetical protein TNIN_456861 [Trichonephila inaurata madagascariensis]|uniref:Uncharacterized protein n=1 Tax=Trichonephila inaurata madagascariensis TaxID=2747483 RepID=A0A8X7CKJ5_9ARAC|nr:hypothetical protein TNIN_456861 [Trichonephila inaurata madagascariensis]